MSFPEQDPRGLARGATGPETPRRRGRSGITDALNRFAKQFDIDLPVSDVYSPSKRPDTPGHVIANQIKVLFFLDPDALDSVLVHLRTCTPSVAVLDDPLNFILDRLTQAARVVKEQRTPRRQRWTPLTTENLQMAAHVQDDDIVAAPPSPTLAVKHLPKESSTVADGDEIVLPPPIDSAKTSFRTSFNSEIPKLSQKTALTSVTGGSQSSQKSEFSMFSLPSSAAAQLESVAKLQNKANADWTLQARQVEADKALSPPTEPKANHRVRGIVKDGLVPLQLPPSTATLPFDLQLEAYRVMRACKALPEDLERQWHYPRTIASLYKLADVIGLPRGFRRVRKRDFAETTLCARLRYSESKNGPVFDFELLQPRKEDSHSFERQYGRDRILSVELPNLRKVPNGLGGVQLHLQKMLSNDHRFCGRIWVLYHLKAKTRKPGENTVVVPGTYSASFFAVRGFGLSTISIAQCLNWFVPFRKNGHLPAAKVYARLDLGQSRTTPTLVFEPDQIIYDVPDKLASKVPDNDEFLDSTLPNPAKKAFDPARVMNDGCCEISIAAMDIIRQMLGLSYIPAVIQARIFGAKGIWYCSPSNATANPSRSEIWIKIGQSQIKALHELSDMQDSAELRAFNVLKWSKPAQASTLPSGFLPIFEDRGVPAEAILEIAGDQVDIDTAEFNEALKDPLELHPWMFKHKDLIGTRTRSAGVPLVAGFPSASEEKVMFMLEAGFEPVKCAFQKEETLHAGQQVFNVEAKKFRLKLSQSTMVLGIADPTGTLKPGEICLNFAPAFEDLITGETLSSLHGREVIVLRNPGRRDSDAQRVRVRCPPELAHLHNVVIFSAKGRRPLADLLSGGDYDGDTFWMTWHPAIVQPFRNAPAPWQLPKPEDLGIKKDYQKLRDIIRIPNSESEPFDDEQVREWIRRSVLARMEYSVLPTVALDHGSLIYKDGKISTPAATALCNLHDLIIDADKQGLLFTPAAYAKLKQKHGIGQLDIPAHRKFTRNGTEDAAESNRSWHKPKKTDIVDRLFFNVVQPKIDVGLKKARATLADSGSLDTDLTALYDSLWDSASSNQDVLRELKALQLALDLPRRTWREACARRRMEAAKKEMFDFNEIILKCEKQYAAIQPDNPSNPMVVEWLRRRGNAPTVWEEVKASAFARLQHNDGGRMMFSVAGDVLCHLKSLTMPRYRAVRMDMYITMKQSKHQAGDEDRADADDDEMETDDDFYERDSTFDALDESPSKPLPKTSPPRKPKSNEMEDESPRPRTSASARSNAARSVARGHATDHSTGQLATQAPAPQPDSDDCSWLIDLEPDAPKPKTHKWGGVK